MLIELKQKNEAIHEAYTKLDANEKKFHAVFANSNDSIFILDYKNKVTEVNKAFCSLIGYSQVILNYTDLNVYIETKFPALLEKFHSGTKKTMDTIPYFEIVLDNGNRKVLELSQNNISYNNNNYVLSIIRDISERRMFEKKIIVLLEFI